MPVNAGIHVDGLKEFRRDLNKIDPALTKEFRKELVDIGREIADDARSDVPKGPTGRAKASIKPGMSGNNAYVQGGKKAVPYYPWLDFGGVLRPTGGRRNTIVRDFRRKGRYLYPAIEKNRPKIAQRSEAAMERAADKAFRSPLP